MEIEMKISIIIPVYNVKRFVKRCIKSIIDITYENLEIIIVNDGSTDGSEKLIEEFRTQDDRIKIVKKKNGGLSSARNAGLEIATGEYILFIDGDDWIDSDCVEKCLPYLNKNIDIIMFSFIREYGSKSKSAAIFDSPVIYFSGLDKEKLVRRLVGPINEEMQAPHKMEDINVAVCKFYKSNIIKDKYFTDTSIIGTEDLWFNLQAFYDAKNIVYVNYSLYHYNKENVLSLTHEYNAKLFERWKNLYSYIHNFIDNKISDGNAERALKNREVINLLALARNVANSNLPFANKQKELQKIFGDDLYISAFRGFSYKYLSLHWKIFYKSCEKKKINLVLFLLFIAEKLKKYSR